MGKLRVIKKEQITKWDFVRTFKPPKHLSIESGNICDLEKISKGTPDYDHVSKMFLNTFDIKSDPLKFALNKFSRTAAFSQ
jgi:hypothetical protein